MARRARQKKSKRKSGGFRFIQGTVLGVLVFGGGLSALSILSPRIGPVAVVDNREVDAGTPLAQTQPTVLAPSPLDQATAELDRPGTAPAPAPFQPARPLPQAATDGSDLPQIDDDVATLPPEIGELGVPGSGPRERAPEPQVVIPAGPGTLALDGPALQLNAVPFEAESATPLVSVILRNAGESSLAVETLLSLSMPLTLGVAAQGDDDVALAAEAKLAGYEVIAELPIAGQGDQSEAGILAVGMSDIDVATVAETQLGRLWMAVAATGLPKSGVTVSDDLARGLIAVLGNYGFAYVSPQSEPDIAAETFATAFGVPYAGEALSLPETADAAEVYAALERAAGNAQVDGTAILAGPATRAMLEGLLRWGLEQGGRQARIAPISAIIARRSTN
ncbi:MAG: divergent polysaccharide deacetylase family protein [Paracoccaceae bacterium]